MNWFKFFKKADFNYKVPNDIEQLLYDFYIITYFIDNKELFKRDKSYNMFIETKLKVLNHLKERLLDEVFVSLSSEFRHINDQLIQYPKDFKYSDLLDQISENIAFVENEAAYGDENTWGDAINKSKSYDEDGAVAEIGIRKTINENRMPKNKMVEVMSKTFHEGVWGWNYGGENWGKIADAWLKLYNSKSQKEDQGWIDHIIDLQHNTGTVFNKLKTWKKDGMGFEWIKNVLDFKASIEDINDLIKYASPSMKMLANHLLHEIQGHSEQEEKSKNKEEYYLSLLSKNPDKLENIMFAFSHRGLYYIANNPLYQMFRSLSTESKAIIFSKIDFTEYNVSSFLNFIEYTLPHGKLINSLKQKVFEIFSKFTEYFCKSDYFCHYLNDKEFLDKCSQFILANTSTSNVSFLYRVFSGQAIAKYMYKLINNCVEINNNWVKTYAFYLGFKYLGNKELTEFEKNKNGVIASKINSILKNNLFLDKLMEIYSKEQLAMIGLGDFTKANNAEEQKNTI